MNGITSPPLPAVVIERLRLLTSFESPETWSVSVLASVNPTYRVQSGSASWIVKRSKDPRKEMIVADLFADWAVPGMRIEQLCDDWMALEDWGDVTLDGYLKSRRPDEALVWELGRLLAESELLGMRDRKLANILLVRDGALGVAAVSERSEEAPRLIQIDYEGAFNAGLMDRLLRPIQHLVYLYGRLYLDVRKAALAAESGFEWPDSWREAFESGACAEHGRLLQKARRVENPRFALSMLQLSILKTRCRDVRRFARLLRRAYGLATAKQSRRERRAGHRR